MNARQKAKKYKKLYYQLLNSPINFTVNTVKFHTVMTKRVIPEEVALPCLTDNNYVKETIARDMAKEIMPYVRIKTQYEPTTCSYVVAGMIRICD